MNDTRYVISVIVAMGLVTFGLRALPFMAAQWLQRHRFIQRLGQFLPLAIMTLLLLHSVVGSARSHAGPPWAEALSITLVLALQWWRGHALLSILLGVSVILSILFGVRRSLILR